MPRPVHFELSADQPERAAKFYADVFGWKINKWEGAQPYWLVDTGGDGEPGINGGIMNRMAPGQTTVNAIGVPSVDEYAKKVTDGGGKVVVPKMAVPGVGYIAYCTDTEGNTISLFQPDESAK